MKSNRLSHILQIAIASAVLTGCTAAAPYLDWNFGYALTTVKEKQLINPEAGKSKDPVEGLDGQAAVSVMGSYQRSFTGASSGASGSSASPAGGTSIGVGVGSR